MACAGPDAVAAAADGAPNSPCRAEGAEHLTPALADAAACETFITALDAALLERGGTLADRAGLTVVLTFSRNGFGRAELQWEGEEEPFGSTGVASMDRPLGVEAIERLAQIIAGTLVEE